MGRIRKATGSHQLCGQVRKELAQPANKGAVDPFRAQGVRSHLLTDPYPGLRLRAAFRSQRHVMPRFVRKHGVFEGLAKTARVRRRVAEVRQGRGERPDAKRAGGFPKKYGPIRFRATGAAHLRDLAQAFLPGSPGFIGHAGRVRNLFPSPF